VTISRSQTPKQLTGRSSKMAMKKKGGTRKMKTGGAAKRKVGGVAKRRGGGTLMKKKGYARGGVKRR